MNIPGRRKQVAPVGSGYFIFVIIGTILTVFAFSLLAFEYGGSIINTYLADKPCLLWAFVIVLAIIGFTFTYIGERRRRNSG